MAFLVRFIVFALFATAGAWGASRVLANYTANAGLSNGLDFSNGGVFVLIPVCIAGALLGAMLAGCMLPRNR